MRLFLAILMLASLHSFASVEAGHVEGKWICGPYEMKGKEMTVTTVDRPMYGRDGSFSELSTSTVRVSGGAAVTTSSRLSGTWLLVDDVIEVRFSSVQFLSSDNPNYTVQMGQRDADAQLQKKNWSKKRVVEFGTRLVTKPVESMYKEAAVLVTCSRA